MLFRAMNCTKDRHHINIHTVLCMTTSINYLYIRVWCCPGFVYEVSITGGTFCGEWVRQESGNNAWISL